VPLVAVSRGERLTVRYLDKVQPSAGANRYPYRDSFVQHEGLDGSTLKNRRLSLMRALLLEALTRVS